MERKEVIISDLAAAVREKEHLSAQPAPDKWEAVPYATAFASGNLLLAGKTEYPAPVTVDPGLTGWYRIYVCLGEQYGSSWASRVDLQLSGDEFATTARCCNLLPFTRWKFLEWVEESLWKVADLTGQSITIRKNDDGDPDTACVLWLRFEPMTDEEVAAHTARLADNSRRTMLAHMDGDYHAFDMAKQPRDYCKMLYAMKESDVEIISQETMYDLADFSLCSEFSRDPGDARRNAYLKEFDENKEAIYREQLDYAHKIGMKMYAAIRMGFSSFSFNADKPVFRIAFVDEHPEWFCRTRDGYTVNMLSYAYPEVQDFVIEHILQSIRRGFDGATLLFSRGIQVLFEQPVIDRFVQKYGNAVDCRRLPLDDPRLTGIWSDIMTEFMEKLRSAMNAAAAKAGRPAPGLFVTGCQKLSDGLHQGVDVARWAKAGLITGVVQTNMTVWEDLDGLLAADGLIDLAAYEEKGKTGLVVKREHCNDPDSITAGVGDYRRLADATGIRFFSELQWENTVRPEDYLAAAKAVYAAGGDSIGLWDCYPARVFVLSEWDCVSRMGSAEGTLALPDDPARWHRIHKILSYKDADIRHVSPTWRG